MSNLIQVHTFIEDELTTKLSELFSADIELISVDSIEELDGKSNVIVSESSFKSENSRIVFLCDEIVAGEVYLSPSAINQSNTFIVREIEKFFGMPLTPKERTASPFTKVKQYKITSRFSIGYYTDLINLKAFESDFDIVQISKILMPILNELVLVRQCSPLELELLLSEQELMLQLNASSLFIDNELCEYLEASTQNSSSFYSLKKNTKRGQLDFRFSFEKKKSYTAIFNSEQESPLYKGGYNVSISSDEKIVDHSNHHQAIVKKITINILKNLIEFLKDKECNEENFFDKLEAYPDKDILKLLKDDEIDFVKRSVFTPETETKLSGAIKNTVDKAFKEQTREMFTENFFNSMDRNTFKELLDAERWPVDGEKLKEEIKVTIVSSGDIEDYDEYISVVKGYVEENYNVQGTDFEMVKSQIEGTIVEDVLVKSGKTMEDFMRDAEYLQMQQKVSRMSQLFTQMKAELEKAKANQTTIVKGTTQDLSENQTTIVKGTTQDLSEKQTTIIQGAQDKPEADHVTIIKGSHEDLGDSGTTIIKAGQREDEEEAVQNRVSVLPGEEKRKIFELEDRIKQMGKELEHKNDAIEVMSRKVDAANASSDENKHELSLFQQKYREEILKVEDLEKELVKLKSGDGPSSDDLEDKLRDANIEIKMYKQRMKFAQSQIQNLEKAKKASAGANAGNKKVAHLEKLMDKQKKAKTKLESDVAEFKKVNHKLNQDNRMLTNKIKELERKLNNKNKSAA